MTFLAQTLMLTLHLRLKGDIVGIFSLLYVPTMLCLSSGSLLLLRVTNTFCQKILGLVTPNMADKSFNTLMKKNEWNLSRGVIKIGALGSP